MTPGRLGKWSENMNTGMLKGTAVPRPHAMGSLPVVQVLLAIEDSTIFVDCDQAWPLGGEEVLFVKGPSSQASPSNINFRSWDFVDAGHEMQVAQR